MERLKFMMLTPDVTYAQLSFFFFAAQLAGCAFGNQCLDLFGIRLRLYDIVARSGKAPTVTIPFKLPLALLDQVRIFFLLLNLRAKPTTLHDMAPTSINTFWRIPIFRRNDDKRYSYSTVPSEDSDSDEDCLMDVISNDGSSVLWRPEGRFIVFIVTPVSCLLNLINHWYIRLTSADDEKKCKFARYCCCGLSIVALLVFLTVVIHLLLGLMLLSEAKSQFGIEKQIQEFQSLVETYHPVW